MFILLVFLTHQVTSTPTLHSYTHTSIGFQTCHPCSWATPDLFLPISCSPVGKKAMTNLDSVSKSRGFADKDPYSQSYVFSVVVYKNESWTVKAEHQRTDALKMWCWRRLLRVTWTARRSNQSILKEINPEYSLEGLMPKLMLQYFGHLMQRADSLEKTLMLGKTEGRRRRE